MRMEKLRNDIVQKLKFFLENQSLERSKPISIGAYRKPLLEAYKHEQYSKKETWNFENHWSLQLTQKPYVPHVMLFLHDLCV